MNREIFAFHDGTKERFGDPLVLRDRLIMQSLGQLEDYREKVRAILNRLKPVAGWAI